MAEEKNNEQAEQPKKKLPIKLFLAIFGTLILEGAILTGVFMFTGQPEAVVADTTAVDSLAEEDKEVEHLLLQDKFQNIRTGRAYLYDTTIYITVKKKNLSEVEDRLEKNRARIESAISSIFSKAEPAYLMEFELSTLTRQIKAILDDRIGRDEDDEDKPFITDVIMRMKRFRAD
ncbi:hypothetical protein JD969_17135 [Planctomycetota bacterium]|nr:hypothetical protein JD969_17135 [Planctomycetota bacterium]